LASSMNANPNFPVRINPENPWWRTGSYGQFPVARFFFLFFGQIDRDLLSAKDDIPFRVWGNQGTKYGFFLSRDFFHGHGQVVFSFNWGGGNGHFKPVMEQRNNRLNFSRASEDAREGNRPPPSGMSQVRLAGDRSASTSGSRDYRFVLAQSSTISQKKKKKKNRGFTPRQGDNRSHDGA